MRNIRRLVTVLEAKEKGLGHRQRVKRHDTVMIIDEIHYEDTRVQKGQ